VAAAPKEAPKEAAKPEPEKPKPTPVVPADSTAEVLKAVNGWA